jgi:hypothetical protein
MDIAFLSYDKFCVTKDLTMKGVIQCPTLV